jgi:starvation-inducible DNA-binding protein
MEALGKALLTTQSTLFHLFWKTWVFHWNVVGPDFHQYHTLFGQQYEAMFDELDRISEHMRYLGIRVYGSLEDVKEASKIKDIMIQYSAEEMCSILMSDNQALIKVFEDAFDIANKQNLQATANILADLMESHGKFVWMLRSMMR